MRDDFILDLLGGSIEEVTDSLCKRITWGVKRADIGIPDPTRIAPVNFEMTEQYYEILTYSLLNGEVLDLRSHSTQVREERETGRESIVYK